MSDTAIHDPIAPSDNAAPQPSADAPAGAPAKKSSGMFWKLIAVAILAAIIGGEIVLAMVFSGDSGEEAVAEVDDHGAGHDDGHGKKKEKADAHGKKDAHGKGDSHGDHAPAKDAHGQGDHGDDAHEEDAHAADGDGHGEHGGAVEVDLGEYSVTAFQAATSTTLLISFHLYGTISHEAEHDFSSKFDANKHRIRDQVLVSIRSAELADLTDPALAVIKRQILEKINRSMGEHAVMEVVFSDFMVVEH